MLELFFNEDAWPLFAATIGVVTVVVFTLRNRQVPASTGMKVTSGFNLFFGTFMAIMGTGHILGVFAKLALGILPTGVNLWYAIPLGFAMAIPAGFLLATISGLRNGERTARNRAMLLNGWLAFVLLFPGAPLAGFATLNLVLAWIFVTGPE